MQRPTTFGLAALVLAVVLACGDTPPAPTFFLGSYAVTAVPCGDGTPSPWFAPALENGRSVKIEFTAEGQVGTQIYSDATCTVSLGYTVAYPDAGVLTSSGFGNSTCAPSDDGCAALIAAVPALAGGCNIGVDSTINAWTHTAIPTASGQTVTFTTAPSPGDACSTVGLPSPFSYLLVKE